MANQRPTPAQNFVIEPKNGLFCLYEVTPPVNKQAKNCTVTVYGPKTTTQYSDSVSRDEVIDFIQKMTKRSQISHCVFFLNGEIEIKMTRRRCSYSFEPLRIEGHFKPHPTPPPPVKTFVDCFYNFEAANVARQRLEVSR